MNLFETNKFNLSQKMMKITAALKTSFDRWVYWKFKKTFHSRRNTCHVDPPHLIYSLDDGPWRISYLRYRQLGQWSVIKKTSCISQRRAPKHFEYNFEQNVIWYVGEDSTDCRYFFSKRIFLTNWKLLKFKLWIDLHMFLSTSCISTHKREKK